MYTLIRSKYFIEKNFHFQVLQNCDELFDREELSAAPDVGWPDCFNSGVFVFKPSDQTYQELIKFALTHGSFDGNYKKRGFIIESTRKRRKR